MRSLIIIAVLALATAAHAGCPTGHALADVADKAFPADMRGNASVDAATCSLVRSHAGTRWLLELDTGATGLLVAVVAPGGTVAWTCCGLGGGAIVDATLVDLDGDGADELVITTRDASNARAVGVQSIDGKHGDSVALAAGARWHLDNRVLDVDGVRYRWSHSALEHS